MRLCVCFPGDRRLSSLPIQQLLKIVIGLFVLSAWSAATSDGKYEFQFHGMYRHTNSCYPYI